MPTASSSDAGEDDEPQKGVDDRDGGTGGAVADQGRMPMLLSCLYFSFGLLLFLLVTFLDNRGFVVRHMDLFGLGSFAFMAAGFGSGVAVWARMPAVGQGFRATGALGSLIALYWVFGVPEKTARGWIEVPPNTTQIAIRTRENSLFVRQNRVGSPYSILFTQEELRDNPTFFGIVLSSPRETYISCIPISALTRALNGSKELRLRVVRLPGGGAAPGADNQASLFAAVVNDDHRVSYYDRPVETYDDCSGTEFSGPLPRLPPVAAAPPGAPPLPAAAPPALPAAPTPMPAASAPPVPPAVTAPARLGQPLRELASPNLDQRLQARADVAAALEADQSGVAATVQRWQVATSTYDEDLGLLNSWLPLLRRSNPSFRVALRQQLSQDQVNYLVSLLSHPDRTLRLAAKETVGWLATRTGEDQSPGGLNKIRVSVQALVAGPPAPALTQAKVPDERLRGRPYYLYDLLDVMQDKFCQWPEPARGGLVGVLTQIPPASLGPSGNEFLTKVGSPCAA